MKLKKINYDFDLNFRLFSIGIMRQVTYDFEAWEVSNPVEIREIRLNEKNCAVTSYSYIVSYEDLFGSTKRSIRWLTGLLVFVCMVTYNTLNAN